MNVNVNARNHQPHYATPHIWLQLPKLADHLGIIFLDRCVQTCQHT